MCVFFFYQGFFSQTLTIHRTAGEGRGPSFIPLYHFYLLTNIETLFATLHERWLSRIFSRNACVYQTATRWDLPPCWITMRLIDWDAMFVCLVDELIPGICYSDFEMGDRWIWIRIDHLTLVLQANRLTKCASHFVSW